MPFILIIVDGIHFFSCKRATVAAISYIVVVVVVAVVVAVAVAVMLCCHLFKVVD